METRVIFFDIGHTLVKSGETSARRLLSSWLGLSEKETRRIGKLIMTHPAEDCPSLAAAIGSAAPRLEPNLVQSVLAELWAEQSDCVEETQGATSTLRSLKMAGVRLGVISNAWFPSYLGFCRACPDIVELLDYTVLSYQSGVKKPAPEIFLQAVSAAGCSASDCWMIGDSYELDVQPARSVGMKTLWVLTRPELEKPALASILNGAAPAPDFAVEALPQILQYFNGMGTLK